MPKTVESDMDERDILQALADIEKSDSHTTEPMFAANTTLYPKNTMTFTERHMAYLKSHPMLKPEHYIANLRLKVKKR